VIVQLPVACTLKLSELPVAPVTSVLPDPEAPIAFGRPMPVAFGSLSSMMKLLPLPIESVLPE